MVHEVAPRLVQKSYLYENVMWRGWPGAGSFATGSRSSTCKLMPEPAQARPWSQSDLCHCFHRPPPPTAQEPFRNPPRASLRRSRTLAESSGRGRSCWLLAAPAPSSHSAALRDRLKNDHRK